MALYESDLLNQSVYRRESMLNNSSESIATTIYNEYPGFTDKPLEQSQNKEISAKLLSLQEYIRQLEKTKKRKDFFCNSKELNTKFNQVTDRCRTFEHNLDEIKARLGCTKEETVRPAKPNKKPVTRKKRFISKHTLISQEPIVAAVPLKPPTRLENGDCKTTKTSSLDNKTDKEPTDKKSQSMAFAVIRLGNYQKMICHDEIKCVSSSTQTPTEEVEIVTTIKSQNRPIQVTLTEQSCPRQRLRLTKRDLTWI